MAFVNPAISKTSMKNGELKRVYVCPQDKSHADITLSFAHLTDNIADRANFNVYITNESDTKAPKPEQAVFLNLEVGDGMVFPEISNIIVGKGQHLYVEMFKGTKSNIRCSGLEYDSNNVVESGVLKGTFIDGVNTTEVYHLKNPLATHLKGTLALINTSNKTNKITVYITSNEKASNWKALGETNVLELTANSTAYIENIMLTPDEKIFVVGKQGNYAAVMNGKILNTIGI